MKILIINGPNLNLLGKREPEIYGDRGFEDYLKELRDHFPGVEIDYFQSNVEGEIINKLQQADDNTGGENENGNKGCDENIDANGNNFGGKNKSGSISKSTGDSRYNAILLNAGGYTHTSVAIADAVAAIDTPVVEVHISSILGREEFRHVSLIAPHCRGTIMGFGLDSYRLGILSILP